MIMYRFILCLSVFAWKMNYNVQRLIIFFSFPDFLQTVWLLFFHFLKHASILALGAWLMVKSIDDSYEQHVWPIFIGRCLFDSWLICDGSQKLIDWVFITTIPFDGWGFQTSPPLFWVPAAIEWFWRYCMVVLWLPHCANVIWFVLSRIVGLVLLEVAVDEFFSWGLRYHLVVYEPTGNWKVITVLGNVHDRRRFDAAKVFDFHDDPTDLFSSLFVVETEERNAFRTVITLWQVSLLNGNKKKIHEFNKFFRYRLGIWFQRDTRDLEKIPCFQSNGVVIFWFDGTVFIYDSKYGKFTTCGDRARDYGELIGVQCLGRLFNNKGAVNGWRIRCVFYKPAPIRQCLTVVRIELREEMEIIELGSESISFNRPNQANWKLVIVRGRQMVGLLVVNRETGDGHTIVYDFVQERFLYFSNLDALLRSDRPLSLYYYSPRPTDVLQRGDDNGNLWPSILTNRECVQCLENGVIYQMKFTPSSLKCCALKKIFAARPNLQHEMSAKEFRQETGIEDMEPHFDK